MISLDFKVDEVELAENLKEDISEVRFSLFVVTYFIMPVKMRVNNLELFENDHDPWSDAPIMNIASNGLLCILELKINKKVNYDIIDGPGEFNFTMIDKENVKLVFKGCNTTETIVKYDELLNAFQQFADKVRKFLWERVPQMNDHPYWGPWLRGERD